MASQQFIANNSPTRFPANFPTSYPLALRIDGTTVDDPNVAFFITAKPTDGNTTSGATPHASKNWVLTVHRSRYEELCRKAKALKDGTCRPCFLTIFYQYLGDESDDACICTDVTIGEDLPLPVAFNVQHIASFTAQIEQKSGDILHELRHLRTLAEKALPLLIKRNERDDLALGSAGKQLDANTHEQPPRPAPGRG